MVPHYGGLCAALLLHMPLSAVAGDAALCDRAAESAAQATGVPPDILLALTRTETGRARGGNLSPWPWSVNQGGDGHWFDTGAEAMAFVQALLDQGVTNVDIGCFQLNLRWHSKAFPGLETMFDPAANALYAAGYLTEKYQDTGDWALAAGAYHSSVPANAERYAARFSKVLADLGPVQLAQLDPEPAPGRQNRFPLLMRGAGGAVGSIVPRVAGGPALFGGVN